MKNKIDGGNIYGLSSSRFIWNVVLYSILLSCYSFSFWLADFQAEYIGADVYLIFYMNGLTLFISGVMNQILYPIFGMKYIILIFQCGTIFSSIFICLIHTKIISYEDPESQEKFFEISMIIFLFIMSLSIQVGFTAVF